MRIPWQQILSNGLWGATSSYHLCKLCQRGRNRSIRWGKRHHMKLSDTRLSWRKEAGPTIDLDWNSQLQVFTNSLTWQSRIMTVNKSKLNEAFKQESSTWGLSCAWMVNYSTLEKCHCWLALLDILPWIFSFDCCWREDKAVTLPALRCLFKLVWGMTVFYTKWTFAWYLQSKIYPPVQPPIFYASGPCSHFPDWLGSI